MKKKTVKILFFVALMAASYSLSKVNNNQDVNLDQVALACNIVAESTDDFCWDVEYITPDWYECYDGGIWSCYV